MLADRSSAPSPLPEAVKRKNNDAAAVRAAHVLAKGVRRSAEEPVAEMDLTIVAAPATPGTLRMRYDDDTPEALVESPVHHRHTNSVPTSRPGSPSSSVPSPLAKSVAPRGTSDGIVFYVAEEPNGETVIVEDSSNQESQLKSNRLLRLQGRRCFRSYDEAVAEATSQGHTGLRVVRRPPKRAELKVADHLSTGLPRIAVGCSTSQQPPIASRSRTPPTRQPCFDTVSSPPREAAAGPLPALRPSSPAIAHSASVGSPTKRPFTADDTVLTRFGGGGGRGIKLASLQRLTSGGKLLEGRKGNKLKRSSSAGDDGARGADSRGNLGGDAFALGNSVRLPQDRVPRPASSGVGSHFWHRNGSADRI
eukprot:TRINITY_DN25148_c0_g1_i1.p1 TRINITY_DN25148_c0_g1~~TRINITY_DN25148_c0_g1_i1.p1  ORF type:complete len:382 (+),score=53.02 TRINITY_DN25148_c0_g1_i1:56-1147(+)